MNRPSKGFFGAMLLIGGLVVSVVTYGGRSRVDPSHTKAGRERMNLEMIDAAVRSYQMELDDEPPVEPKEFFASLGGGNSRGVRFLSGSRFPDSDSGVRCDAWKSPYQVSLGADGWVVRSAGPDGVFESPEVDDSDDMAVVIPKLKSVTRR